MKNTTEDMNNMLMALMEDLSDQNLDGEQLDTLVKKTRAAGELARVMIENNRLVLDATRLALDNGQQTSIPKHVARLGKPPGGPQAGS